MAAKTSKTSTKRNTKRPPATTTEVTTDVAMTDIATSSTKVAMRGPTTEEIARRAFELYLARGREHGRAQEDWLKAERELRERTSVS